MKNKKRTIILVIIALIAVVGILVGTTYAYFTASVTNATAVNENVITTGTMALEFTDGPEVKLENAAPGSQVEKTFKVKNIGTVATKYDVYFSELINTFADKTDLVYTLESSDGGYNTTSEVQMPDSPSKMVDQQAIGVNETHTYKLTVTFKETNDNQNDNAGKIFSSKIDINKFVSIATTLDTGRNVNMLMKTLSSGEEITDSHKVDTLITSFERSTTLDNTDNIISTSDSKYPIYMWYDDGTIKWYSDAPKIYLNENCLELLYNLRSLSNISFDGLDSSNVKSMYAFFGNNTSLINLDISSLSTSEVTNMNYMFGGMNNLENLTFGEFFNTSNVTNMSGMFFGCNKINNLDLSHFDTSNVTSMSFMFFANQELTSLDLSSFNTTNVTNMDAMFGNVQDGGNSYIEKGPTSLNGSAIIPKLERINFGEYFNTSNVTSMDFMFAGLQNLSEISLLEFNTSNVTSMNKMFFRNNGLTSLDLSSFDTSKVRDMQYNFGNCKNLVTILVSNKWNVDAVLYGADMFAGSSKLKGGAGTAYSSGKTGKSYAHVDGGTSNPGYLTLKS